MLNFLTNPISHVYTQAKFYWCLFNLKRNSSNLNQFLLVLGKIFLDIPYSYLESEIKTYNDVRSDLLKKGYWTFMWTVKEPKKHKVLVEGSKRCETFSSYSYLDLIRNEKVQKRALEVAGEYASGNHSARMISGNMPVAETFEKQLANFFGRDNALVMSSGFLACMSAITASVKKGDLVIADKFVHASLRTGLKLAKASGAELHYFGHNNFDEAENILRSRRSRCNRAFMVIESVYSMDGDFGLLDQAHKLAERFDVKIILDEAHGLGAFGETGRGLQEHYNLPKSAWLIVGSLTKSLASLGGYIVGDEDVIRYMEFFTLGNMFSAPLSAYHIGAAQSSLHEIIEHPEIVTALRNNAEYMHDSLSALALKTKGRNKILIEGERGAPVIPVIFPGNFLRVLSLAQKLKDKGYLVSAVVAPACPLEKARFRITAQSTMTYEQIDRFVEVLEELNNEQDKTLEFSLSNLKDKLVG